MLAVQRCMEFYDRCHGRVSWHFFDVHWLVPSLGLLEELVGRGPGVKVLVVGDYAGRDMPLLHALGLTPDAAGLVRPPWLKDMKGGAWIDVDLDRREERGRIEGAYDVVVFQESLEHLFHDAEALAFLRSRLLPGGAIWFSTPMNNPLLGCRAMDHPTAHVQAFSIRQLGRLFDHCGLRAEQEEVRGFPMNLWYSVPARGVVWLLRRFAGERRAFQTVLSIAAWVQGLGRRSRSCRWLSAWTWCYGYLAVLRPAEPELDFSSLNRAKYLNASCT